MRYAPRPGLSAYALHRITGVGIWVFLLFHVTESVTLKLGPEYWNRLMGLYRLPVFAWAEAALLGALLFHGLNGLRVIVVDFTGARAEVLHKVLLVLVLLAVAALLIPGAWLMVGSQVQSMLGAFGGGGA